MATDKQIAANRANAQHCTGPASPEGLAISSQNALKTGIDAKSEVMRCESRAEYDTLIAEYYERYHPTVPEERSLVDLLIKSEWLCRRYISVECALWERGFVDIEENSLTRVFNKHDKAFDRVDRRMNSAQRNFQKALRHLTELRAKRVNEPCLEVDAAPSTEPTLTQTTEPAPILPTAPTLPTALTLPSRDCKGAVLESPAIATKPLNQKLVSFLQNDSEPAIAPAEPLENTPETPKSEDNPPIAA